MRCDGLDCKGHECLAEAEVETSAGSFCRACVQDVADDGADYYPAPAAERQVNRLRRVTR